MYKNPYETPTHQFAPQRLPEQTGAWLYAQRGQQIPAQAKPQQMEAHATPAKPSMGTKAAVAKPARMTKQQALKLADIMKKGVVVASLLSFGGFSWLAANQIAHTTTTTSSSPKSSTSKSSSLSTKSGGFFSQKGSGYSIGSSSTPTATATTANQSTSSTSSANTANSSSSQSPVTSSSVS